MSTHDRERAAGRAWTPGPWRAVRQENGDYRIIYNESGNWIAEVHADGEMEAAETDARLIAAAPELFEALQASQKAIRELRTNGAPTSFWDDIEAANIAALSRAREGQKP